MNQPSNSPSLTDQFREMQKEAAILEQTIQHRKSELQAVQRKLTDLQTEFDRKTLRLLEEQSETLDKSKRILIDEQADIRDQIERQKRVIERNTSQILGFEIAVVELNEVIAGIHSEMNSAEAKLNDTKALNDELIKQNSQLGLARDLVLSEISSLDTARSIAQTATMESEALKMRLIEDVQSLEVEHDEKVQDKEKSIALIDAKILESSQQLDLVQDKERLIRGDLATWQRTLEEKDKNLRIRERKVDEGENKIVNNASLMNL